MGLMDWVGFVTGVVCVYLIVRERDVNWPIGVVNSLALLWVFWGQKLYAQVGLQVFYVGECLYGWWVWTRRDEVTGEKRVRIGWTPGRARVGLSVAGVLGLAVMVPVFRTTGDPAPFWDSVVTVASLVAEYMLCVKLYEAWGVYLAADVISLVVLAWLGQWVTFGTYLCFAGLCVMGLVAWRRSLKPSESALSLASSTL